MSLYIALGVSLPLVGENLHSPLLPVGCQESLHAAFFACGLTRAEVTAPKYEPSTLAHSPAAQKPCLLAPLPVCRRSNEIAGRGERCMGNVWLKGRERNTWQIKAHS